MTDFASGYGVAPQSLESIPVKHGPTRQACPSSGHCPPNWRSSWLKPWGGESSEDGDSCSLKSSSIPSETSKSETLCLHEMPISATHLDPVVSYTSYLPNRQSPLWLEPGRERERVGPRKGAEVLAPPNCLRLCPSTTFSSKSTRYPSGLWEVAVTLTIHETWNGFLQSFPGDIPNR